MKRMPIFCREERIPPCTYPMVRTFFGARRPDRDAKCAEWSCFWWSRRRNACPFCRTWNTKVSHRTRPAWPARGPRGSLSSFSPGHITSRRTTCPWAARRGGAGTEKVTFPGCLYFLFVSVHARSCVFVGGGRGLCVCGRRWAFGGGPCVRHGTRPGRCPHCDGARCRVPPCTPRMVPATVHASNGPGWQVVCWRHETAAAVAALVVALLPRRARPASPRLRLPSPFGARTGR
jgi:hypothetical protein